MYSSHQRKQICWPIGYTLDRGSGHDQMVKSPETATLSTKNFKNTRYFGLNAWKLQDLENSNGASNHPKIGVRIDRVLNKKKIEIEKLSHVRSFSNRMRQIL